jgi:hypothetical protein
VPRRLFDILSKNRSREYLLYQHVTFQTFGERIVFEQNGRPGRLPPGIPRYRPRLGKEWFFLQRRSLKDRTPAGYFSFAYSALASFRVGVGVFPERGRDFGLSGGWAEVGAARSFPETRGVKSIV